MSTIIRPAVTTDLLAVRAQLVATWHATYDPIYGAEMVRDITRRWHSLTALAEQLGVPGGVFLLAERDGRVLGSSYAQTDGCVGKLYRLYIHPQAQHRGLGQRLLRETMARLPSVVSHRLEVEPRNLAAIRFYEQAGFERRGEIADLGRPDGIAAYIYERAA